MPDWIDGAIHLRARRRLLGSSALAFLLCRCAVYDSGLVDRTRDGGTISSGSGGSANQPTGSGGEGSTGGTENNVDAASNVSSGGAAGAIGGESGGAAGAGGASGGGAGGSAGACGGGVTTDLALFQNGTFVPGYSTTGSWKTCNGTPINATVNAIVALAVDLSCNTFNGVYIINWNSLVPPCYSTLSFDIYFASPSDITPLKVYLQNSQGPTGLQLDVISLLASPQAKAFNHVSLPLTSFGTDLVFNGVGFFNASAAGIPLFYVNNVVLGVSSAADAAVD